MLLRKTALVIAAVVTPSAFGMSRYWVNDDLGNAALVSGAFAGVPEMRNPFMGLPLTSVLVFLYSVTEKIPWYPLAVLGIPLSALLMVMRQVGRSETDKAHIWSFSIGAIPLLILAFRLNYTFSSAITSGLVVIYFLNRFGNDSTASTRFFNGETFLAFILLVFGFSLRSDHAFELGFVISTPLIGLASAATVAVVVVHGPGLWGMRRALLGTGSVVLAALVVTIISTVVPQLTSDEWYSFVQFNSARGRVQSTEYVDNYLRKTSSKDVFSTTGLNPLDFEQVESFRAFDASNVTTDSLNALERVSRSTYIRSSNLTAISYTKLFAIFDTTLLVGFVMVLLSRYLRIRRWGLSLMAAVASTTFIVITLYYLSATVRAPDYVKYSLLCAAALGSVFTGPGRHDGGDIFPPAVRISWREHDAVVHREVSLLSLFAVCLILGTVGNEVRNASAASATVDSVAWRDLLAESADYEVVAWVDELAIGDAWMDRPFDPGMVRSLRNANIVSGGTLLRSPAWTRRFEARTGKSFQSNSLYSADLIEWVAWSPIDAEEIRSQYRKYRGICFDIDRQVNTNWVKLRRVQPCSNATQM